MEEQEAKERESKAAAADEDLSVDWLQTRRQVLQENEALDMLPPDQAKSQRNRMSDIPVKKHTLLSKDEIASCLQAMGGRDIKVIIDLERRMGGILGIILVTAVTRSQIRVLADALVRQMRRRQLEEVNVVGAQLGPEGNTQDDGWWAVDCRNFVVHIQDEETRWAVDLEALWSGNDDLHGVDPLDEEQVDDYVAQNPVPASFGRPSFELSDTLKQLEKSRWTQSQRPVVPKRKTGRKRRKN
jgi:ribosomal silencing factor RsfS